MEYKIVLETFEGPMDLLLHLIDKAQIDIYDIPINEVTEQYLDYLTKMEELDLEITSEFLVMAATLLEIKSKLLLPQVKNKDSGDQLEMDEADPRLELVKRLVEYKKYKYASSKLRNFEEVQNKVYYKPKEDLSYFIDDTIVLDDIDLKELVIAFRNLMIENKENENMFKVNEIERKEYSLDECIINMKKKLNEKKIIKFRHLFKSRSNRKEIVITFLSLLELIRNKYVIIYQENNFSDIIIKKINEEGEGINE
ncbi:segregation/condensation protein A [Schnuerera sp. xch1]|uniref:segregation and condensation protein A n=1 Tax=Schnuerera sp. xch1 TaxID=2874283 RepID=UPI001CBDF683|nr:segregation/condensation protein A [Schnuerera sp. xch1]MBZ2173775.1 segregation/condensation protein A [Schnuerera sp. xch1]